MNPFTVFKNLKLFKSEDSSFMLKTGLKVLAITIIVSLFAAYDLFQNMRLNYLFLKSTGFSGLADLKQAYFDFILADFSDTLIYLLGIYIGVFLMGLYIAKILLRPFKNIGEYCQKVIENKDLVYKVDQFSDYRLLTRFSELFFQQLRDSREKNKLQVYTVSAEFMGIHKPVMDKLFLFHFSFFLIIILIVSTWTIVFQAVTIYENIVQIGLKFAASSNNKIFSEFVLDQRFVIDELYFYVAFLLIVFYSILAIHLYAQVSGAAFGIFSTMRSYVKGNYFARVHLVGFSYIREHTRSLNKYLEFMQKNYSSQKSNEP